MKDTSTLLVLGFTTEELKKMPQQESDKRRAAERIRKSGRYSQAHSELCYLAARAIGKPAPISPEAKAEALAALDTAPIVDPALEKRARAAKAELEDSGWGFSLEKRPTPIAVHDPNAGLAGRMASPRLVAVPPLALVSGRPQALASDPLEPPASSRFEHFRAWRARRTDHHFSASVAGDELVLEVLDVVGEGWFSDGVTAKGVKKALDANPKAKTVRLYVDSPGGDAFHALAITNLLKASGKTIEVEVIGEASSAASVIAMAGDTITMHEGAMMMVHAASSGCWGFAEDLRQSADVLDKLTAGITDVYVSRTGRPRSEIEVLVKAETWMTASEAVDAKFATRLAPGKSAA